MNHYLLETKNLSMRYGEQYAVKNLSLHVPKGKIYGLLGRNGAGKTTAMKMVMQLIAPTEGEILLFGESAAKNCKKQFKRIGAMIETPGFYGHLTAHENLEILAKLRGVQKPDAIESALKLMGLGEETKKRVSHYSLGMNQRLGIAAAILHEPELLILDEPTNGLDPIGIREMRSLLRLLCEEKQTTIVISSHILSEVEQLVDCMGILQNGELLQEITMEELHQLNRSYTQLQLSPLSLALPILERECAVKDYIAVDDRTLRIFDTGLDISAVNKTLVSSGINVYAVYPHESSLEDYFTKLTGGKGIA